MLAEYTSGKEIVLKWKGLFQKQPKQPNYENEFILG